MAKFIVTETRPSVQIWTYEVEANSAEEAEMLIFNGEVTECEAYVVEELQEDSEFEVEQIG